MPLTGMKWSMSQYGNVAIDEPGVYELWDASSVIYIGSSTTSVRDRVKAHKNGDEGTCTQQATDYKEEASSRPRDRERQLLREYQNTHGRLPRCNDRIP